MEKKKTRYLKEMSWTEFDSRREKTELIIIPSGAFEVYGPHLPLGTDTLVSEKISEIVAEKMNGLIGPTLEVGDSSALNEFPGTITIKPENFKEYMKDTVRSLQHWGYRKFLFLNTHKGNIPLIKQVMNELENVNESKFAQIDYWRFLMGLDEGIIESEKWAHTHASEAGTSVMLHLYPELVDVSKWVNEPPRFINKFPDILNHSKFSNLTKSGTIGNATLGTKEKGEQLVNRSVNRIIDFLIEDWDLRK